MSNLFNLIKINFSSYFSLNGKNTISSILKLFLFLALYFIIGLFIYRFAEYMVNGFHALNMEDLALSEFFAFSSLFILALSIFRLDIFNSKDHDLLMSLPISKKVIVASKLLNIYIFNLLLIIIIMGPLYIAYINQISFSILFLLKCILSLFVIPIIPTVIAVFINSFITIISTNFKHKKIIQTLLMLLLMIFSIYFAFNLNSNLDLNLLNIKNSFETFFNKAYPLTNYFTNMLIKNDMKSMIVFVGLSILLVLVLILFLSLCYNKVTNIVNFNNIKNINYHTINNEKVMTSLVKKDLKRVIYSPNYLLNSCLGLIFILIMSILLLYFDIDSIKNIPLTEEIFIKYLPLIFLFLILLSCTTSSLISIEGKKFYILKMLPIKFQTIWVSKVLSNLILIIITCLLSLFIFNISLDISLKINIQTILIVICSGIFISVYGLVINLLFPIFSWKNEIKVIKQSAASFITIFSSLMLGVFLVFNDYVSNDNYIYYISIGFLIISLMLALFLNTIGAKIYQDLQN